MTSRLHGDTPLRAFSLKLEYYGTKPMVAARCYFKLFSCAQYQESVLTDMKRTYTIL